MAIASSTKPFKPLVRDLLFSEIALRENIVSPEVLQKGWAVVKELHQFGISRHLASVLIERKLLDPKIDKEVTQYFSRIKVTCASCRKAGSLEGMDHEGRVRCAMCGAHLSLELGGADETIADKPLDPSRGNIESRLKSVVLQAGDGAAEAGGKRAGGAPAMEKAGGKSGDKGALRSRAADGKAGKASESKAPRAAEKSPKVIRGVDSYAMPEAVVPAARPRIEELPEAPEPAQAKAVPSLQVQVSARHAIQRYQIDSIFGHGPYGRIYRGLPGEQADKKTRLAIKLFAVDRTPNLETADLLAAELKLWNQFQQELLTPAHSLEQEGNAVYVVRNLIGDPFAPLAELRLNEWEERTELLRRITHAIARIHKAGRIHGNLKPTNIFICKDQKIDQVLLVDPALHLILPKNDNMLRWKILADGPRYRSPEEINGQAPTPATDVYSLGWIFFAILSGSPPFTGIPAPEILRRHLEGPCQELSGEMKDWSRLINAMTALQPKERPQSALQVLGLVQDILAGKKPALGAVTPRPTGKNAAGGESRSRQSLLPLRYALGPAALAAVAAWAIWCFVGWHRVEARLSGEDRNQQLFNALAAEELRQTRADASAGNRESARLWERYLQIFRGSASEAAAESEIRNIPGTR